MSVARSRIGLVRIAVVAVEDGGGTLCPLGDDGTPAGPPERVSDLVAAVAERERASGPRWVWTATNRIYPDLLAAGVRVARCHDLELTEALLLGHDGRYGEPRSLRAALARLVGGPVPDDIIRPGDAQPALFDTESGDDDIDAVIAVHAAQRRALAAAGRRLTLLAAAESAGGLSATEMGHDGLPWRPDVHDALLTELLGPRPGPGLRPRRLQDLADRICAAFGGKPVNPDSPPQLVRAFAAHGVSVPSTRSLVLRGVDHPAVPLVLEYKELARLYASHGWAWLESWVRGGRFRPEYVVGGVVSGRWASRGGGALQIPRVLRRAVVADPGWRLVVADAAQLEPRVLAALAGDSAFAAAAATGDLYTALAEVFGGARDRAKIALLSAMYGGAGGEAAQLLTVLRRRFPDAAGYVEAAARQGEAGRLVRSRLGRTCPPPSAAWRDLVTTGRDGRAGSAMRSRGRFTRNFVVQASAADWALVLLAVLRRRLTGLAGRPARLVFFQHDEVIIDAPEEQVAAVSAAVTEASTEAGRLVFGDTPVRFPVEIAAVECYAEAK